MRRRGGVRRLAAALLAGCLLLPAGCSREPERFSQWPEDISTQMRAQWRQEDPGKLLVQLEEQIELLLSAAQEGAPMEELQELYARTEEAEARIETGYSLACWDYYGQPQVYAQVSAQWSSILSQADSRMTQARRTLFSGERGEEFRVYLGEACVERALESPVYGEEQLDMLAQETELINRYHLLSAQVESYTVSYGGKEYSRQALERAFGRGELSREDYLSLRDALLTRINGEMGALYLELVELRNRFARSLGYENYAEYAYPVLYGRDYTTEEAAAFCQEALELVGPLNTLVTGLAEEEPSLRSNALAGVTDGSAQTQIALVQAHMGEISGQFARLFQYMLNNKLLDTEELDTKLSTAFTGELPEYGSAYLYISPAYLEPFTLVHEFGHFADACLAPDTLFCLDLSEICSQGLEALYMSLAGELVGEKNAPALLWEQLGSLLDDALLSGALYGAFELEVYTAGEELTVEGLNKLYSRLCAQAGRPVPPEEDAGDWYEISHLFEAPCYYVSYATSAASALEILLLSHADFQTGTECYLNLVAQTGELGYRRGTQAAGLTDMLAPGALEELTEELRNYAYEELLGREAPAADRAA